MTDVVGGQRASIRQVVSLFHSRVVVIVNRRCPSTGRTIIDDNDAVTQRKISGWSYGEATRIFWPRNGQIPG